MKKKVISLILLIVVVMSTTVVVFATPATPYSTYYADIRETYGGAIIKACSCAPVDNYLYCSLRLQYLSNGTYKWTNWGTSSGSNTDQKAQSWTVYAPDTAKYSDAKFEARCGSGGKQSLTANASR